MEKKNQFSIVIPTLNESRNIGKLIKKINNVLKTHIYEIIVVDDNSEDGTKKILEKINLRKKNFIFYIRNKKKDLSQSLIFGIKKTNYQNIIIMDGDLQHDPKYLNKIINIFYKKKLDILVCTRNFKIRSGLSRIRYLASILLIFIINFLLGKKLSDPMSGFFIFKKNIYFKNKKKIYGRGFKLLLDLVYSTKKRLKIFEYIIKFKRRKNDKSKMNLKVIFHIIIAILNIFYQNFKIKN